MGIDFSHLNSYYIHYDKEDNSLPWEIILTDKDISKVMGKWLASDFEVNVPCWSYKGYYYYLACNGVLSWDGTKAIIDPQPT